MQPSIRRLYDPLRHVRNSSLDACRVTRTKYASENKTDLHKPLLLEKRDHGVLHNKSLCTILDGHGGNNSSWSYRSGESRDSRALVPSSKQGCGSKSRRAFHTSASLLIATHSSLNTYLAYAERMGLSRTSTTYLGTQYEYLVQAHLQNHFGFQLTRIGGRGDSGIDLLGTWNLHELLSSSFSPPPPPPTSSSVSAAPIEQGDNGSSSSSSLDNSETMTSNTQTQTQTQTSALRVLVQCKRLSPSRTPTPSLIRELEASFLAAPVEFRSSSSASFGRQFQDPSRHQQEEKEEKDEEEKDDDDPQPHRRENGEQIQEYSTLAILVCTRPATKGIRQALARSHRPLAYMTIEEISSHNANTNTTNTSGLLLPSSSQSQSQSQPQSQTPPTTKILQFIYNKAATTSAGLMGIDVGLKHDDHHHHHHSNPDSSTSTPPPQQSEIHLLYKGKPIKFC